MSNIEKFKSDKTVEIKPNTKSIGPGERGIIGRFAIRYGDGSLGILSPQKNTHEQALKELLDDEEDAEIVYINYSITRTFGFPNKKKSKQCTCDCENCKGGRK